MKITLSPQRRDADGLLSVIRIADTLTINGEPFDFSQLPEGATLPGEAVDCEWITGSIERINGEIHLSLILPHGPNPPHHVAFPEPIHVTEDGPVALPTAEGEVA